jgi:hypothetical protein
MRLLLHIGGEKTGTTTLQAFLTKNSRLLLKKYGILYPASGPLFFEDGHFPVVSAFLEPERSGFLPSSRRLEPGAVRDALAELFRSKRPELIILSAEHFSSRLETSAIGALARTLSPFALRILFYVRRQDDLAVSAFSSTLHSGGRRWLDGNRISPEMRYYNHLTVADDWSEAFGRSNVIVRSYDAARGGIERDFLAVIGIEDASDFESVAARNRTVSLQEAVLLHLINRYLPSWEQSVAAKQEAEGLRTRRLRERLRPFAADQAAERVPLGRALGAEARMALMSAFDEPNRQLADRYGVRIPDEVALPIASTQATLDTAEQLDLMTRALARAGREIVDLEDCISKLQARTLRGRARAARAAIRRHIR